MKGPPSKHSREIPHAAPIRPGHCRQRLQHCDPCNGDGGRVRVARSASERATSHQPLRLIAVMSATASVLMVAHLAEVLVWSFAYSFTSIAPPGTDLVYFAFVNYTTLGYGDVTPLEHWRLLGPMAAMNGMLLFGWSTAVIFEVLRRTMTAPSERNSESPSNQAHLPAPR